MKNSTKAWAFSMILVMLMSLFISLPVFADEEEEKETSFLGYLVPQITNNNGSDSSFGSDSDLSNIQGNLVMPFTYQDWKNIEYQVTDLEGNVLAGPSKAEMQFPGTNRTEMKLAGNFHEGDTIVLEIMSDNLPKGYHVFHDMDYSYGGYPAASTEGYKKAANKITMKLKGYDGYLVPDTGDNSINYTFIYFAIFYVKFDPQDGTINGESKVVTNRIQKDNSLEIPVP